MNILLALLATAVATAVTVTVMLLVRRRAPEGSYFADGDRASGVFGVLATGFSVLLGFIIFLAFTSYDDSRSGAEILRFMRHAVDDLGQTTVIVTHDPVAAGYADRIVFLADGKAVDEMMDPTAERVLDRMKNLGE